jgi:S1/P1 Nuclease
MTPLPKRACTAIALALAMATPAYPWAREGHMAVATIARENLSDDARRHIVKLLGKDDLTSICVYMDELRTAAIHAGELAFDPEAQQFNHDFPDNAEWHFVDLPLGTKAYAPDGPFAKQDDVVHAIGMAISVLEGGGDPRITKTMALRMIVHFVGDIHQPLHTISGYYTVAADGTARLVTDPEAAKGLPSDKGGNVLFFGPSRYDELHSYWDFTLPERITHTKVTADLVKVLEAEVAAEGAGWKSPGDYHHWAEGWATESLEAAQTAYKGITFGASTPDPKGGLLKIMITLPPGYDAACVPLAQRRLAQGGYHLAELLNAIHWAD